MSIDRTGWSRQDGVTHEMRSGLAGLGGRPVLHPAWREPAEPREHMAAANAPRAWPALGLPAPPMREHRLAA